VFAGQDVSVQLLLVEDDRSIAVPLVATLEAAGHEVIHVTTGSAALDAKGYDLVLLDIGLPDIDGHEVCRRLRAVSSVPVIILTARGDEFDRVLGLELGADDYVTKPFSARELQARIRAVSRRYRAGETTLNSPDDVPQQVGSLSIDRRARRVFVDGDELELTAKEFDLLAFLAEDPGAVRSRLDIMEAVWDSNWFGPTKTLDVHIAALRRKLGSPDWITAIRSVGFRFERFQP
jgi:DNA-binding response OmpR family regulator